MERSEDNEAENLRVPRAKVRKKKGGAAKEEQPREKYQANAAKNKGQTKWKKSAAKELSVHQRYERAGRSIAGRENRERE
jgi:hypothetical protein